MECRYCHRPEEHCTTERPCCWGCLADQEGWIIVGIWRTMHAAVWGVACAVLIVVILHLTGYIGREPMTDLRLDTPITTPSTTPPVRYGP